MNRFRKQHLLQLLEGQELSNLPLDVFLRNYFRSHKSVGSKDRKFLAESVYGMIRNRGLVDAHTIKPLTWQKRAETFFDLEKKDHTNLPPHVRLSFPKKLYELLVRELGTEKAEEFCRISNEMAPTTIRVNPAKISRDDLLAKWKGVFDVIPTIYSPHGITFLKKENFFALPEFKEGLFEIQDEGSQLVAEEMEVKSKDHVLDYCSGAGGKTLAFAYKMHGTGQIYVHDIRNYALDEGKKRFKRAGIQNVQRHRGQRVDHLLLDVPCSGTGTFRRNPDQKWKFDGDKLPALLETQRAIFTEAERFVKPGGMITYATCSVLPLENECQAEFFLRRFPLELAKPLLKLYPTSGGGDGFFAASFKKKG